MNIDKTMACPKCNNKDFLLKQEAKYVYSYKLDTSNFENTLDKTTSLPFLFDNRELDGSKQYIECEECNEKFPTDFKLSDKKIELTILQKAIRADHTEKPEFFG